VDVIKNINFIILTLNGSIERNIEGKTAIQKINPEVRNQLRIHHIATHVIAAAT
jgi:alanyl-tRNA synthetase